MNAYLRSLGAKKLLRVATILCFVACVLLPLFVWLVLDPRSSSSSIFRNLAAYLFHSVVFLGAGIGLIGKQKWARYVAIFESVLAGAVLMIAFFIGLLSLFNMAIVGDFFGFVAVVIILIIATSPGYILLQPEVKDMFSPKER